MRALHYLRQESAKVEKAKEKLQGPIVKESMIIDRQTSATHRRKFTNRNDFF